MPASLWIPEGCLDYAIATILRGITAGRRTAGEPVQVELRLPPGGSGRGGWQGAVQHALKLLGIENSRYTSALVFLDADSSAIDKVRRVSTLIGQPGYRALASSAGRVLGVGFDVPGGKRLGLVFWCDPSQGIRGGDCGGRVEDVLMGILGELYGCGRTSSYSIKCGGCPGGSSMRDFARTYDKLVAVLGLLSCVGGGTLVLGGGDRCGFDAVKALRRVGAGRSRLVREYAEVVTGLL